jgi:7-cyano-7-deazaguanine reductase
MSPIEVIENKNADRDYAVNIEFPEFTCVCPKTGLPDFATIKIEYVPDKLLVELKSLKLYFVSFRNVGTFHEDVVNKILDDLVAAVKPRKMTVTGEFNVRGGIRTTVTASK